MSKLRKFGVVSLIGRPNVGKSSLLNKLVGEKISIVSRRPQTTWRNIDGVYTKNNVQLMLTDTPGLNKLNDDLLSKVIAKSSRAALTGTDLACLVIDSRKWTPEDRDVLNYCISEQCPTVLVVNKVDLLKNINECFKLIEKLKDQYKWQDVIPVSAKTGLNCDRLRSVLVQSAEKGDFHFELSSKSSQDTKFLISEFVREQIFRQMGDEIPYASAVEIQSMDRNKNNLLIVNAVIWCQTDGQKAAIIGKKGERLKKIGSKARVEIERCIGEQIYLSQIVKVRKNWSNNQSFLYKNGYIS